jgi:hypothetical protein
VKLFYLGFEIVSGNILEDMLTQSLIASKINLYQDETSKNINIDNFELPDFEDSKYVLTSPRSLIACENLGIKVNLA